jgi:hypothetical protein
MEAQTEEQKKLRRYAEAIIFFMEHPDATEDPVTNAYVENIKKMLAIGKQLKIIQN